MKDSKGYRIKLDPIKMQQVVDLWLGDKAMTIREVCDETGAGYYQVQQVKLTLERSGKQIKKKKQPRNAMHGFVINGNTEADADKNREEEQANKPKSQKDMEDVRQELKKRRWFRELIQIKSEAKSIG